MFQIETYGVLNGHLVFPEHVMMNQKPYMAKNFENFEKL
jgi:hypothetical protein